MRKSTEVPGKGPFAARKAGYITLEAAIMLPVFIMALAMLCFIIRYAIICENAYAVVADETEKLIQELYLSGTGVPAPIGIKHRLEENLPQLSGVEVSPVYYDIFFKDADSARKITFSFGMKTPFEGTFAAVPVYSQSITFRPFIGCDNSAAAFEKADEAEAYHEVWVFPRAGEKYHSPDCRFIVNYPRQCILSAGVRLAHKPCRLCGAASAGNGSVVYCFYSKDSKYHTAECSTVDKYVISMDEEDAKAAGYTACKVCGGYHNTK